MKTYSKTRLLSLAGAVILLAGLAGCRDLFRDPLADKDSGKNVTVLLMDRNFITTKLAVRLIDMTTGESIDSEQVEVRFVGSDAASLITFAGIKQTSYNTSTGFVEIGLDPNIVVNNQNPLEMTVIAISENYISVPQFVSFTAEGIKNLTIRMTHRSLGKSISSGPFSEPYDIYYNGVQNSSQLQYLADISGSPTGTAYEYINMYTTGAAGTLICNNLKDNVLYTDYGVYFFGPVSGLSVLPPAVPTRNTGLGNGDFVYSTVLRSGMLKCNDGLTIHTEQTGGGAGTGVFGYLITFSDGNTQSGQITCTFPCDNLIEPIYYPGSGAAVTVVLNGDSQYLMSAAVSLPTACGSVASFVATPRSNLTTYKFITQYSCPDSPVGMGLSIMGEFRKSGTTDDWTIFEFIEGICELQLEHSVDYDFRVNIDSEYYSYSIPTDPSKVEEYLIEKQNEDYQLRSLTVTTGESAVTIKADIEFSQGVCDKIR